MLSTVAIVFFVAAAIFGSIILAAILKDKPTPKPAVIIHGTFAIIGILILATYVAVGHYSYLLIGSLVIFAMAALGGLTMFFTDMSKKPISKVIAIAHPLLALTGLALLIIYALQ